MNLALLTLVKWVEHMCVVVSRDVVVGCCRCRVGEPWYPVKLSNCGLDEEWWSCWLEKRSCCCVMVRVWVKSHWEAPYQVPYFPFNVMYCRSMSACSKSVYNQRQLLGSIVKDQLPYFHKFLLFMEVSPVFGMGTSQFWMASRSMPVKLFVLNPFFSRQQISTKKVLHCSHYANVSSSSSIIPKLKDKWYRMFDYNIVWQVMTLMFISLLQTFIHSFIHIYLSIKCNIKFTKTE